MGLVNPSGGGSVIKSIQRGTLSGFPASPATITITAVNTAKAFLTWNSITTATSQSSGAELTNGTTITATSAGGTIAPATWQVIEYN